jgi:hypothetical protein
MQRQHVKETHYTSCDASETSVTLLIRRLTVPDLLSMELLLCFSPRVEVVATVTAFPCILFERNKRNDLYGESTSVTNHHRRVAGTMIRLYIRQSFWK